MNLDYGPGDRVKCVGLANSFRGQLGTVHTVKPLMVTVDGDKFPMAFSPREIVPLVDRYTFTGAE